MAAHRLEARQRHLVIPVGTVGHTDDAVGIAIRKRPQQQRVGDREKRRIRADAERERQDSDRREAFVAPNRPHALPYIAPDVFDKNEGLHFVTGFVE